ncbi:MAG TPA: DUF3592 domain-containing protein, partial [Microlunatus sp.]|nr:DUF3592 domain-containing protein [Microlunatus sp.]
MKVLRILGLIFGILLLLTGGGLLAASAVADRGQSAVQQQLDNQGLKGPVQATVVEADPPSYTVEFTDENGEQHTATAASTLATPPSVGDTVTVFYKADDPSVAAITDVPTSALGQAASTLQTAGFITLGLGGVLLIAAIVGFVVARKAGPPAIAAAAYPGQPAGGMPPGPG